MSQQIKSLFSWNERGRKRARRERILGRERERERERERSPQLTRNFSSKNFGSFTMASEIFVSVHSCA